ncbi:hypothetical protein [Paractinoplanes toevensis]|uniref:Alpha/beta hydrolase n=1 Tax=Paractinoplanes toevensis TaxID=571911 RepID=A0A919TG68_9ACTN|nr:hypothetical protein [Actinoplanes toevensis]GIM94813.1 alpha/beta hydrolase [Actinoplanes toevensis]
MTIKRVLAAAAASVLLLGGAYAGFLGHRSRHAVSLAPDGPYRVGRAVHEVADRSRTDELAPLGGNPRVLSVWLWYPAAAGGTPSPYAPGEWAALHRFGWGQTDFQKINTGTYDEAPLAAGTFPIVVLTPGLGLSAPQYAALAARIASRGYLVAGVTPTYSADLTVIGGKPIRWSAAGRPADLTGPRGDRLATVQAADARFVAGRIAVLLGTHADPDRVIYVGHGSGGAAALEACRTDDHCRGAADLDGTPRGQVATGGLDRPVLLLGPAAGDETTRRMIAAGGRPAWAYTLPGTGPLDFTDYAAYWLAAPVRRALRLGNPATVRITADYLAAFLDSVATGAPWRAPAEPGVRAADIVVR